MKPHASKLNLKALLQWLFAVRSYTVHRDVSIGHRITELTIAAYAAPEL